MSIRLENYEEYGKQRKVVVIDKSDNKHLNRCLSVLESVDVLKNVSYRLKAS